jgi:hypothetical protein
VAAAAVVVVEVAVGTAGIERDASNQAGLVRVTTDGIRESTGSKTSPTSFGEGSGFLRRLAGVRKLAARQWYR